MKFGRPFWCRADEGVGAKKLHEELANCNCGGAGFEAPKQEVKQGDETDWFMLLNNCAYS